jgi:putative mycofactocin binding protein MftB
VRGLLSVTDERVEVPAPEFDPERAWRVHPQVALRDESFGALAYHYGTRRLLFLKSRTLVDLVSALERFESATAAIEALVPENERAQYARALARLVKSEVIDAR